MPKPLKENLSKDPQSSIRLKHSNIVNLDSPWHYHAHYELFYVIKSSGRRFVGDNISNFTDGDLVFLGSNLPHLWKNPEHYYSKEFKEKNVEAICLQFDRNAFGESFFDIPEMVNIRKMLESANRGICIKGEAKDAVIKLLLAMLNQNPYEKFISLMDILSVISFSKENEPLATIAFTNSYYHPTQERMSKVFEFIANNYKRNISLEEVAAYAGMSKAGFCRHFKSSTIKTFVEYLNEVKINYACRLIVDQDLNISEVSYECGFNNISYFNRTFKSIIGCTPSEYKNKFNNLLKK